jgi:hypothetical protein
MLIFEIQFKIIDGERKSWELGNCIKEYSKLNEPVKANLTLMIKLRNKIEHHSSVLLGAIDSYIFGECQTLLYNYENTLVNLFGESYAINENLVYSLQFSKMRTNEQSVANRQIISNELKDIKEYIDKYRTELKAEVYNSQEYSIKLIQIPKISNTSRGELAIEFVNWSQLNETDRVQYDKVAAIIKDKRVVVEAVNAGKFLASDVFRQVKEKTGIILNYGHHGDLCYLFRIRPRRASEGDPFNVNIKYCQYDQAHKSHVYTQQWIDILCNVFGSGKIDKNDLSEMAKNGEQLKIADFEKQAIQRAMILER